MDLMDHGFTCEKTKNSDMTASVSKVALSGHKSGIISLFEIDKGNVLHSSSDDGTVRVWDTRCKNTSVRLIRIPGSEGNVGFVKRNESLAVVSRGNKLFGYDLRSDSSIIVGKPLFSFDSTPVDEDINDFDLSSETIAVPTDDGSVKLISTKSFTEAAQSVTSHENIAAVARLLPSGDRIVSGGYDCKVSVSKLEKNVLREEKNFVLASLLPPDEDEEETGSQSINPPFVTSMEVCGGAERNQIAVGSGDGSVVVFDLHRGGSKLDTRRIAWGGTRVHGTSVSGISWSDDNESVWSVGNDRVLLLMDQVRLRVRYDLGFKPNTVVSMGAHRVAVGGLRSEIEILEFR